MHIPDKESQSNTLILTVTGTTNANFDTRSSGMCKAYSWLTMIINFLMQICYYNYDYLKFKTVWNGL